MVVTEITVTGTGTEITETGTEIIVVRGTAGITETGTGTETETGTGRGGEEIGNATGIVTVIARRIETGAEMTRDGAGAALGRLVVIGIVTTTGRGRGKGRERGGMYMESRAGAQRDDDG